MLNTAYTLALRNAKDGHVILCISQELFPRTTCNTYCRCNTKEPLLPHNVPCHPWSKVGADLFDLHKKLYFLLVYYYSGFIEVYVLSNNTSPHVIECCKSQFSCHGMPEILITDNGYQFSSYAFKLFMKT